MGLIENTHEKTVLSKQMSSFNVTHPFKFTHMTEEKKSLDALFSLNFQLNKFSLTIFIVSLSTAFFAL